jgi:hypothetical protein
MAASRNAPVTKDSFVNPHLSDLPFTLLQDIYCCQYWAKTENLTLDTERQLLGQSYLEFLLKNWNELDSGDCRGISSKPSLSFKEDLTEAIVTENAPDLSKDEELKVGVT